MRGCHTWLVIAGLENNLPAAACGDIIEPVTESSWLVFAAAAMKTVTINVMWLKTRAQGSTFPDVVLFYHFTSDSSITSAD